VEAAAETFPNPPWKKITSAFPNRCTSHSPNGVSPWAVSWYLARTGFHSASAEISTTTELVGAGTGAVG
jgi:hypothetical protein